MNIDHSYTYLGPTTPPSGVNFNFWPGHVNSYLWNNITFLNIYFKASTMNIFHHLLQCLRYSLSDKSASTYDMVLLWKLLIWNLSIGNFSSSTINQYSNVTSPEILQISTKYLTRTCISLACNILKTYVDWRPWRWAGWVSLTSPCLPPLVQTRGSRGGGWCYFWGIYTYLNTNSFSFSW